MALQDNSIIKISDFRGDFFKNLKNDPRKEFAYFVFEYLFTILGIPTNRDTFLSVPENSDNTLVSGNIFFQDDNNNLIFAPNNRIAFTYKCMRKLDNTELSMGRRIIEEYLKFSMLRFDNRKSQNSYKSLLVAQSNYKLAIQMGVCDWIFGEQVDENNKVGNLLSELEKWSVKTYEGKRVTFGFLINREILVNENAYDYIEFIEDDYSATISDCINSLIEIDRFGKFIEYHSITDENSINKVDLDPKVPYRFAHVLSKYVTGKKVGVFLLNNGDIVLSESGKIMFVKRNLRWLNLSYEGFSAAIDSFCKDIPDMLKESIYGSMLDVSFSHTGGIISVIYDMNLLENDLLANVDDIRYTFGENDTNKEIEEELKKEKTGAAKDNKKRIKKRNIIKKLVGNKPFERLDRKLRSELIAMDGACIMEKNGTIHSFGAIIKNNSGSSGGGRGAAAKKLSEFGFAIKISTDGYIELYSKGEEVYSVK